MFKFPCMYQKCLMVAGLSEGWKQGPRSELAVEQVLGLKARVKQGLMLAPIRRFLTAQTSRIVSTKHWHCVFAGLFSRLCIQGVKGMCTNHHCIPNGNARPAQAKELSEAMLQSKSRF